MQRKIYAMIDYRQLSALPDRNRLERMTFPLANIMIRKHASGNGRIALRD
jgi:hypothetical protein